MTFIQNIIFSALFRSYSVQGLEIFTQTGHNKYVHTKEKDSLFAWEVIENFSMTYKLDI